MLRVRRKHELGFSLVEVMAVIVIVGILVALALPRFRLFVATARQAEAHANLGIIASLQQTYYLKYNKHYENTSLKMGNGGDSGTCTDDVNSEKNLLGFRSVNCANLRYTYTVATSGVGKALNDDGPSGKEIYPGCTGAGKDDEWTIDSKRVLTHTKNVIEQCKD